MKRGIGHAAMRLACLFVACAAVRAAAYQLVEVGDGETVTIGVDVDNSGNSELRASAGATIVLPASANAAVNVATRIILVGNGTVTLAAPGDDYVPTAVHVIWGITAPDSVTLHVSAPNVTALKVGNERGEKEANYAVADIANVTFANANGVFGLRECATVRKIPAVYTVDAGNTTRLALYGANPLHLTDSLHLTDFDVVALTTSCIPDGCTVRVAPGRTFYMKPCTMQDTSGGQKYAFAWFWAGNKGFTTACPIVLEGKGARVICRNNVNARLVARISGTGELLFRPDTTDNVTTFYRGLTYKASPDDFVTVPVDAEAEPGTDDSWKAKVSHWFDAADAESFIWYDYNDPNCATNYEGHPLVIGWKDTKKGIGDTYLYNRRMYNGDPAVSQNVPQVLPCVVANGLNGLPYVACVRTSRLPFHSASTEATGSRAPTGGDTAPFGGCPFCIMVFGSQDGGGKAILGTTERTFSRKANQATSAWMTNSLNVCKLIVDGQEVRPLDVTPNGGWQILSLDMSATNLFLSCIGAEDAVTGTSTNPGGQRYAELIFFSEKPTPEERVACERYLAEKWGLARNYLRWDVGFADLSGVGTVNLTDENMPDHEEVGEITVAGSFAGTINVPEGKTLVVSPRPAPPSPSDLPQQDKITAWFDPSLEGAIDFNESGSKPTGIARLYSRTAAGVDKSAGTYWMGMQAGADQGGIASASGRFPFLVQRSYSGGFGAGRVVGWMDFEPDSQGSGNTLRSHPINNLSVTATGAQAMPVHTVFMALDTSSGGGNPFAETVGMTGKLKPRKGWDVNDPIWSASNTVTMAHTWLGTNEVDGTATGFNGRGEVLGFEYPSSRDMGVFLGFYKGGGSTEANYEHIGETLLYNTTLTDAERLIVQKYLLAKWVGDYGGEYSDLTAATVTGAGVVKSASLRNFPQLDAGFTGSLAGGGALAFTIDRTVSTTAAVDALAFDKALALDGAGTVSVSGSVLPGTYTLLTATSLTGGGGLTLQMSDDRFNAKLAVVGNALVLHVNSPCTTVIIR